MLPAACRPAIVPVRYNGSMRIGIDIRFIYDHFPGIGRYLYNLVAAMVRAPHGHRLLLLHNPALPNTRYDITALAQPHAELVPTPLRPFSLLEQIELPRLAHHLKLDLLHSPYYVKPYIGLPCPSIVTIYDLIGRRYPQVLSRRSRYLYRTLMDLAVLSSRRIITISANARDDLRYYYRLPHARLAVVPGATDAHFRPQPAATVAAMRQRYGLPPRYVLYLGANKPHKNLPRLVRAWERVLAEQPATDAVLVLAGHEDPRYPEVREMVAARGLTAHVQFLSGVAEGDLPALYSGAEVFIFPSFYEGFGLPPLEAMACGAPVLCAYASSLPEVVGNAAMTFDPYSFLEMAEQLQQVLSNARLRQQLRQMGLQQAQRFSWERAAQATLAVYEEVLA